jgi:hypothetical protein
MSSKIGAGLMLFFLLMALSLGVAFAEKGNVTSSANATLKNNTTMNESMNNTLNQTITNETMNKTMINVTMNKTMTNETTNKTMSA